MTISVTTESKLFYDKEGLLWKKCMTGSQFYYENRVLFITIQKLEGSSGGQFKFHLRRKFYCGKEFPYKKDFFSGKGKEFCQEQEILFLQRTFYYEKEIWLWKTKLFYEKEILVCKFH